MQSYKDLRVIKIGLQYYPPAILVEYSVSSVAEVEPFSKFSIEKVAGKYSSSIRHCIIECSKKIPDIETLKKCLIMQYPHFFGRESTVSEDQLNRILSMLIVQLGDKDSTTDWFERNRILPDSVGYEYDKRKDFEAPLDDSSWDY